MIALDWEAIAEESLTHSRFTARNGARWTETARPANYRLTFDEFLLHMTNSDDVSPTSTLSAVMAAGGREIVVTGGAGARSDTGWVWLRTTTLRLPNWS